MGGVNLHDHKYKLYFCSRKSKKWWPHLFYFLVNVAMVNAHILETLSPNHKKCPHKEFRLDLAMEYLTPFQGKKTTMCTTLGGTTRVTASLAKRQEKLEASMCPVCKSYKEKCTHYKCSTCNVGVHPEDYHA